MISEFALFLFTLTGGTAAGAYICAALFPEREQKGAARLALPICALVLLAIGGIALLLHLGHPERMFFAFSKPAAGIAAEGYATVFFGAMVAIDFLLRLVKSGSKKVVRILCAVGGLWVSCAMGYAYFSYTNVAVWHAPATWLLFLLGNIASGSALYALWVEGGLTTTPFNRGFLVAQALALVAYCAEAATLASNGEPYGLALAGTVAGPISCLALGAVARKRALPTAVFTVLAFAGLALVRYAFYAVV